MVTMCGVGAGLPLQDLHGVTVARGKACAFPLSEGSTILEERLYDDSITSRERQRIIEWPASGENGE